MAHIEGHDSGAKEAEEAAEAAAEKKQQCLTKVRWTLHGSEQWGKSIES
jgi:hypothetical protein